MLCTFSLKRFVIDGVCVCYLSYLQMILDPESICRKGQSVVFVCELHLEKTVCFSNTFLGGGLLHEPCWYFLKWFQKCVFVWSVYSPIRTRPCVSQIGNFIHCVKICTPPILMSLLLPPVLIAGLYNCTDDWAPQTVWQATTTQHTQMSGSLNSTPFFILLWMIKEACPIITHEKLTQPSVWINWGSFVCFAVSQSRNLMFSPLRLGSALVSHLLTSTSFGLSRWPVAGLQLHIWPPLPLQSADVDPKLCVLLTLASEPLNARQLWYRCSLMKHYHNSISRVTWL